MPCITDGKLKTERGELLARCQYPARKIAQAACMMSPFKAWMTSYGLQMRAVEVRMRSTEVQMHAVEV